MNAKTLFSLNDTDIEDENIGDVIQTFINRVVLWAKNQTKESQRSYIIFLQSLPHFRKFIDPTILLSVKLIPKQKHKKNSDEIENQVDPITLLKRIDSHIFTNQLKYFEFSFYDDLFDLLNESIFDSQNKKVPITFDSIPNDIIALTEWIDK